MSVAQFPKRNPSTKNPEPTERLFLCVKNDLRWLNIAYTYKAIIMFLKLRCLTVIFN